MMTLLFIILGGLLSRAKGWGAKEGAPVWQNKLAEFFSLPTCSALFALLTFIYSGDILAALTGGAAFAVWRGPGFKGWERWGAMFWRGLWTSTIGFTMMSLVLYNHPYYGLLAIPMGIAEMLAYSGARKWLTGRLSDNGVQIVSEVSSGFALVAYVALIVQPTLYS